MAHHPPLCHNQCCAVLPSPISRCSPTLCWLDELPSTLYSPPLSVAARPLHPAPPLHPAHLVFKSCVGAKGFCAGGISSNQAPRRRGAAAPDEFAGTGECDGGEPVAALIPFHPFGELYDPLDGAHMISSSEPAP